MKHNRRKIFSKRALIFSTSIGLLLGAVQVLPAQATTITVTPDALTYIAGSGVIPTLTVTASAINDLNITCRVYTSADTGYVTPVDLATIQLVHLLAFLPPLPARLPTRLQQRDPPAHQQKHLH